MQNLISRRTLINRTLLAAAVIPALGAGAISWADAALTPLDPSDPMAKSLHYLGDSSKVDASANPTHKADQTCANCSQYQGKAASASGGCNLFAGKSVSAKGWCNAWAKKP
jgi:hypothetical protein